MPDSAVRLRHTVSRLAGKTVRLLLPTLLLWAVTLPASAQDDEIYRMEVGVGAGAGFMLDDTNAAFYGATSFTGGALLRFVLNPRMAVKTSLTYTKVGGSTEGIDRFYPSDPTASGETRLNYRFDGAVYDLSALYELHFLPYGLGAGYLNYKRFTPYLQMGFGLTYGTSGKAVTANFPLGFGFKYKLSRRLNLGLDWTMHFSLSDKLDGLEAPLGIKSSMFRNKDHYSQTMLTLTYDISPKCPDCNRD